PGRARRQRPRGLRRSSSSRWRNGPRCEAEPLRQQRLDQPGDRGHVHQAATRTWFDSVEAPRQSFLRLLTTGAVLAPYGLAPLLTNREAWRALEALLGDDRVAFLEREPADLQTRWSTLATRDSASPKLWMDAYLAAFAIAGSFQLVTTDSGFRRFSGLEVSLLA
ncbi:MAG: TA system VapC family ribonuclease toxin, partial [Candidatus Dormibacteraceae bacterium]